MRYVLLSMALLFGSVSNGLADIVEFKNGDHLSGKFVRVEKGKLIFKSNVAGEVTVKLTDVKSFATDEAIEIHLKDGTVLKSKVSSGEQGRFIVAKTDIMPRQDLAFADVKVINPPPKPKVKWHGDITGGFSSTHGNTFTESGSINVNLSRRSEKDRITLSGLYIIGRSENSTTKVNKTTEESFTMSGKYDYFLSKKWYYFINGRFKKDHIADLDRRIIGGMGFGYQWIESENMKFSTDAGLAELCEQFTREGEVTKKDEVTAQLGYHFDTKIYEKLTFQHNLTYFPSIAGKISDYFLTANVEIRLSLTDTMYGSFKAILDYDSTPAKDVGTTDTKYILGVGWKF